MAEVMSQKQIDELLGNLQRGDLDLDKIDKDKNEKQYKLYDFRSPKRITREQIKLLDSIFENFMRLFALHLSSILRMGCEIQIVQIEEQQYNEFSNALDDSVLISIFDLIKDDNIDDKQILLEMARPVSYSIIDRLLGGNGQGYNLERDYTDIELSIMEYVFKQVAKIMNNSWSNYIDSEAKYSMIETNSRLIQSIAPEETVVIIVAEVTLKTLKSTINICLPSNTIKSMTKSFDTKFARGAKKNDNDIEKQRRDQIMSSLGDSLLNITANLGETSIEIQDLLSLQVGDVISLDTLTTGNPISVYVEDMPWFSGEMGIKKKKYAVKIGEVL